MNIVKHISAILTCTVLGCILLKMIEGIGHRLNPGLGQLDKSNYQTIVDYAANLPPISIGFLLFAYFVGSATAFTLSAYMTTKWELPYARRNGMISGLLILIYGLVNLMMISYAHIVNISLPFVSILGTVLGLIIFSKTSMKNVKANP